MPTPCGAYRAATAAAKVANWVAEAGVGDTSPLVPAFAAHPGHPSMIRSTDIPLAWADLTTWSSGAHVNVFGPAYCTPFQSASSLIEVIPMAFIAASSDACTFADFVMRSGSAMPTCFPRPACDAVVAAEAAPAKPRPIVRAPAAAAAVARVNEAARRLS